jgi:universal stress protein E
MSRPEKLFVVVDPNDDHHIALERAIITSALHTSKPHVHAFVAVDGDAVDTRSSNDRLFRDLTWFEQNIKSPLANAGISYTLEVSWSGEWQKSIVESAKRLGADLIYLPVHAKTNPSRFSFTESKWELLKTASCPVVLIRPSANAQRKVILAAVNFQTQREVQVALNKKIIEQAKHFAKVYGADLQIINGYLDSMNYPDRAKIIAEAGLPNEKIHVENGYTSEVVSALAARINADLIVMGTLGQNGMTKTRRGNTAERLIAAVDTDVMVINHE